MAKKHYPMFEIEISKNFPTGISTHIDWKPATNIVETKNSLLIEMELPSVVKEDISVTMLNNQELIVKGVKRQSRSYDDRVTYYLFEREFGTFYKRIVIDFPLDTGKIHSTLENGVLTIEITKKQMQKIAVEIK